VILLSPSGSADAFSSNIRVTGHSVFDTTHGSTREPGVLNAIQTTPAATGVGDVLALSGTLDRRTTEQVRPLIVAAIDAARPGRDVVLDLAHVTHVDSCGLGLLLAAHRRAAAGSCRLVLRSPGPGLARAVAVTKLNRVLCVVR
jgi:anti-sigma B factor antagonist